MVRFNFCFGFLPTILTVALQGRMSGICDVMYCG